eukprot:11220620-Lingulodinium_polyedra.AAC.1
MSTAAPPRTVSPVDVGKQMHVAAVASVEVFLRWCLTTTDNFETYMAGSSPEEREQIRATLGELAATVKQGEH